jgi:hypothetical protein
MFQNNLVKSTQTCEFCFGDHSCRDCDKEKKLRVIISNKVGLMMEEYLENNILCRYCNRYTLTRRGDNSPSLDLECKLCKKKIEVKSKCLSIDKLPNDITCKGGNFIHLLNNIKNKDLDLVLIIYGVNRKLKEIKIRNTFWIYNNQLQDNKLVQISKNYNLSTISIFDIRKLERILPNNIKTISFKNWIEKLIKQI